MTADAPSAGVHAGAEVDEWLAPDRALWTARLDRLEQHVDSKRQA